MDMLRVQKHSGPTPKLIFLSPSETHFKNTHALGDKPSRISETSESVKL